MRRKARPRLTLEARHEVRDRDLGCCCWCGRVTDGNGTIEHLIPIVKGGTNHLANLRWACRDCNLSHGAGTDLTGLRPLPGSP